MKDQFSKKQWLIIYLISLVLGAIIEGVLFLLNHPQYGVCFVAGYFCVMLVNLTNGKFTHAMIQVSVIVGQLFLYLIVRLFS